MADRWQATGSARADGAGSFHSRRRRLGSAGARHCRSPLGESDPAMSANRGIHKNIDPRVAAALILGVLAVVQYIWWQGLVSRPRATRGMQSGGGGARPGDLRIDG